MHTGYYRYEYRAPLRHILLVCPIAGSGAGWGDTYVDLPAKAIPS